MNAGLLDAIVDVSWAVLCLGVLLALTLRPPLAWRHLGAILASLFTVATAVVGVGAVAALVPGDPVARALGEDAPEQARAQMRRQLGLHHSEVLPPLLRPLASGGRLLRGLVTSLPRILMDDDGDDARDSKTTPDDDVALRSHQTGRLVWAVVLERLPQSMLLGIVGTGLGAFLGTMLGLVLGLRRRSVGALPLPLIVVGDAVVVVLAATPRVVLAPLLLLLFAIGWRVLPAGGDPFVVDAHGQWHLASIARALVLPAFALALPFAGVVARHVRAAIVDVVDSPFITAARARGAGTMRVVFVQLLPHALLPVVQLVGLMGGAVLAGTVIVERVFSWPGLGMLLVTSLSRADLPVVAGIVSAAAVMVRAGHVFAVVGASLLDPRLRRGTR